MRLDFDGWTADIRHLVRSLRRTPGFAVVTILTLALGIGVTTAITSVVDHALLKSLPFRDADRLVVMFERDDGSDLRLPSPPTVADWRRDQATMQAFESIAFIRGDGATFTRGERTERGGVGFVGPEFFSLIAATPMLGRVLTADDHRPDAPPVIVLANWAWRAQFGGDPTIIGKTIGVDSVPTTVVGVMPVGVRFPEFATGWQPVSHYRRQDQLTRRGLHVDSRTIGRLRPGVDSARAANLMKTVAGQLAAAYPIEQAHWHPAMIPLRDNLVGSARPMLLTLGAASLVVLLLACANVANLLLARAASRARELAIRSALGAPRRRIIRQMLTESVLLSAIGGALGMLLASYAIAYARRMPDTRLPRAEEMAMDHRVFVVAVLASLLTALVCGIWPALRASRPSSGDTLRSGSSGSMGNRGESRLRRVLVAAQFALALMLLAGAGLLVQSFRRAASVNVGFKPEDVLSVRVDPPASTYGKPEDAAALYTRLIAALSGVPGVTSAAFINHMPFGRAGILTPVEVDHAAANDTSFRQVYYRTVSASYLQTLGMSLARGRWFTDTDMRAPGGAFVVNETMAKRYWPGENAVGKRLTLHRSAQSRPDFGQPLPGAVIGVIRDVRQFSQDLLPAPEVYVPYTLEPWTWGSVVVRAHDSQATRVALRDAIAGVDPRLIERGAQGAEKFSRLANSVEASLEPRKLSVTLIGAFATCALVLAAIGMSGVVSYGITQRTRELGVRKALGATNGMIASLVLRESVVLAGIGIVVGCAGAFAAARLIRGLLFETGAADPLAYLTTIAVLTGTAIVATLIPARRATRLDPTIAMRGE